MRVKNWEKFQHFKDRRPPWIKLYREFIDQRDISLISDWSFRVLVFCWILASEDDDREGNLPSIEDIAWRMRVSDDKLIKGLRELTAWIEFDDIDLISDRYQSDAPEKRREETETEVENNNCLNQKELDHHFETLWNHYPNKQGKKSAARHWSASVKTLEDVQAICQALKNYLAHMAVNDWKRPMNGSTWFNNWHDWENWQEPKAPKKKDPTLTALEEMNNALVTEIADGAVVDISPAGITLPAIK